PGGVVPMVGSAQPGHRGEEPSPIAAGSEGDAHEQAPVLERVAEELSHEDPGLALGRLGEADRAHRRQTLLFEVAQNLELASGDLERFLLEGECPRLTVNEPDEMARRADVEGPEPEFVGPVRERAVPRQIKELGTAGPQTQARK